MENLHEGHRKRQREQYDLSGETGMPDHVLLELLLTYAIPRIDVNPLAHRLLDKFGSLSNVFTASTDSLMTVDGVGKSTALLLKLVFDLHTRISMRQSFEDNKKLSLHSPDLICRYGLTLSAKDRYETARLLCLNARMQIISSAVLSVGTLNSVIIDPRQVIEQAILQHAYGIVLYHNHPSGNVTPSQADIDTAKRIQTLAESLQIRVFDQIVLGDAVAYSFERDCVFSFPAPGQTDAYSLDEYLTILARNAKVLRTAVNNADLSHAHAIS